jgi:hypothetical protein
MNEPNITTQQRIPLGLSAARNSTGKHSEVCRDQYDARVGCPSA